jgi:hypothetical protein
MSFKEWAAAGFTEALIPIIPPDGELSPLSDIEPEQRGKSPGRMNGHGTWGGLPNWRAHPTTERDLEWWTKTGAGVGLRTARFPAVDIDIMDEALAALAEEITLRILGPAPVRIGRAPKRALAYRTEEPFGKMTLLVGRSGTVPEHKIEVLGDGQQYVVGGLHPVTRRPYTWSPLPQATELSVIDRAMVEALFIELERVLPEHGFVTTRKAAGRNGANRTAVDQEALKGDIATIAEAVALIPNTEDTDRDAYVRMGMAIKAATIDDPSAGFEIWAGWAEKWPGGNTPEEIEKRWEGFKPDTIGADWIYSQAAAYGFNAGAMDFEALGEAPAEAKDALPVQFSDSALALRFLRKHGADVRFEDAIGRWFVWNDRRWARDDTELAFDLVRSICDAASAEALRLPRKDAERIATRVASGNAIGKAYRIARTYRGLAREPEAWDPCPWTLNTED